VRYIVLKMKRGPYKKKYKQKCKCGKRFESVKEKVIHCSGACRRRACIARKVLKERPLNEETGQLKRVS